MISSLFIKNIALIDSLNVEFSDGLNIISGETGAGKSILIDSINFVLGDRADKTLIRYGEDSARVEVVFQAEEKKSLKDFFDEYGLEFETAIVVSRSLTANGRSECRINGRPVSLFVLKKLVSGLVDLHGQHENQSLMDVQNHLRILDNYANGTVEILTEFRAELANYKSLNQEKSDLMNPEERARQIELLEFQRDEIISVDLKEGEESELSEKRERFAHMEKILSAVGGAADALDGDGGAVFSASAANAMLASVTRFDRGLEALTERLESAKIELTDIAEEIKDYLENSEFDMKTREEIENRFDKIRSLKRKYGRSYEEIQDFLEKTLSTLEKLYHAEERFFELDLLLAKSSEKLQKLSRRLYEIRKKAAEKFEKSIVRQLNDLGMKNTSFCVSLQHSDEVTDFDANGGDKIEFLISANKGEPLKPLQKIASGGELSRFMLALKNIIADLDAIDTMIFDEIDTGISGNIAKVVAQKLANISKSRQVLVVTHLPQIAAMSDKHFLIEKTVKGDKTVTAMTELEEEGVLKEIVRLTGGVSNSQVSISHSEELRAWALEYKKSL